MAETDALTPRDTSGIFGHEAATQTLLSAWREKRMPHAWIISGAKGIGKATLAYHVARMVLSGGDMLEMEQENPIFRRVSSGSHTDLLVVEPAFDEKKEEYKSDITVEEAREIGGFLSKTPAESEWRVVIVDPVDALNVNAANAVLKIVEEPPPQALLLLVSHNPGRLLPTIRSRCRMLRLSPPGEDDFRRILSANAPTLGSPEISQLGELTRHAPGLALEYAREDALSCYEALSACFKALPKLPLAEVQELSGKYLSEHTHTRWQILTALMLGLVAEAAQGAGSFAHLQSPSGWARLHTGLAEQFSLAARLHLDYKTVLLAAFDRLTLANAA